MCIKQYRLGIFEHNLKWNIEEAAANKTKIVVGPVILAKNQSANRSNDCKLVVANKSAHIANSWSLHIYRQPQIDWSILIHSAIRFINHTVIFIRHSIHIFLYKCIHLWMAPCMHVCIFVLNQSLYTRIFNENSGWDSIFRIQFNIDSTNTKFYSFSLQQLQQ